MKNFFLLVLAIALFNIANAQQNEAVMNFSKTSHDFGNITQETGPASVKFEFVNTGSKPIVINDVKSSCGCTTPSWTKAPIAPGAKGYVEAVYDPRNRPGHFSKTITVYSNATNSPVVLTISGNVKEKQNTIADVYPQEIGSIRLDQIYLNFGSINNTDQKTLSLKIYNPNNTPVKVIVEDRYKPSYVTVKVEPEELQPKQEGKLTITYNAAKVNDWDYVRGFIYLTIDGQRITNKRIQVSAIIKETFSDEAKLNPPRIEFEETSYNFGTANEGDVIQRVYKFKNTGKSDLYIRKTHSSCGCTAVTSTSTPIKPGETGEIKATFNTSHKQNKQIKTITVITNCPEPKYNKVVLRLEGFVNPKEK